MNDEERNAVASEQDVNELRASGVQAMKNLLKPRKRIRKVVTERVDGDGEIIFTETKTTTEDVLVDFSSVKFVLSRLESELFRKEERDLMKARVRSYEGFEDMLPELSAEDKMKATEQFIQMNFLDCIDEVDD